MRSGCEPRATWKVPSWSLGDLLLPGCVASVKRPFRFHLPCWLGCSLCCPHGVFLCCLTLRAASGLGNLRAPHSHSGWELACAQVKEHLAQVFTGHLASKCGLAQLEGVCSVIMSAP